MLFVPLVHFGVLDILKLQSIEGAGWTKVESLVKVSTNPLESSMLLLEADLSKLWHHVLT